MINFALYYKPSILKSYKLCSRRSGGSGVPSEEEFLFSDQIWGKNYDGEPQ